MNSTVSRNKVCLLVVTLALTWLAGASTFVRAVTDPSQVGPCTVLSQTVDVDDSLSIVFYYPGSAVCAGGASAPYPGVAFAHGFSMFGFSDGAADNAGNGQHLASWGYVVAIPRLEDDNEQRVGQMQDVLDYIQQAAATPGSFLHGKVDAARLAAAGYSLGGTTALALAARDARVRAVVALDPVYHEGGFGGEGAPVWDPGAEAPNISVPAAILGAPPSNCNAESDYLDIYPLVGAAHKASFRVVDASHCDFADPGSSFCGSFCDGPDPNEAHTRLSKKYMTAWLNYYLYLDTGYYAYLYGTQAGADITAGRIQRQLDTAPRGLQAMGLVGSVQLQWERYDHPIVAGYDLYRRIGGGGYGETPYAQLGPVGTWRDTAVAVSQVYSYTVCSRDPAGNEHQCAAECSASPTDPASLDQVLYLPLVARSTE